jgi:transposase
MPYDYYIGVDYHKAYSHFAVQDSSGKTLRSGRVRNDRQSVGHFLAPFSDNAHAVLETTRNWTVMYDWLDEICDDVVLAHPLKVKANAEAKIKTDKIDATILCICGRDDQDAEQGQRQHQTAEDDSWHRRVLCPTDRRRERRHWSLSFGQKVGGLCRDRALDLCERR